MVVHFFGMTAVARTLDSELFTKNIKIMDNSPYSSDLTLKGFLFPRKKHKIRGLRFTSAKEGVDTCRNEKKTNYGQKTGKNGFKIGFHTFKNSLTMEENTWKNISCT